MALVVASGLQRKACIYLDCHLLPWFQTRPKEGSQPSPVWHAWSKLAPTRLGGSCFSFCFCSLKRTEEQNIKSFFAQFFLLDPAGPSPCTLTFLKEFFIGRSNLPLAFLLFIHQPGRFCSSRLKGGQIRKAPMCFFSCAQVTLAITRTTIYKTASDTPPCTAVCISWLTLF